MKRILKIQNLKCVGCETCIEDKLYKINGVVHVNANASQSIIELIVENENAMEKIVAVLNALGYPVEGENNTIIDKSISFISCAKGRVKNLSKSSH